MNLDELLSMRHARGYDLVTEKAIPSSTVQYRGAAVLERLRSPRSRRVHIRDLSTTVRFGFNFLDYYEEDAPLSSQQHQARAVFVVHSAAFIRRLLIDPSCLSHNV